MWLHVGPEEVLRRRKRAIFGFDGRGWLCFPSKHQRRLDPGAERVFTDICGGDHQYRASTTYWVGFQDADGNLWRVSANRELRDGVPQLRGVKSIFADFGQDHRIRTRIKALDHYRRVMWWLFKYRKEETSRILPWERDQPDETASNWCRSPTGRLNGCYRIEHPPDRALQRHHVLADVGVVRNLRNLACYVVVPAQKRIGPLMVGGTKRQVGLLP